MHTATARAQGVTYQKHTSLRRAKAMRRLLIGTHIRNLSGFRPQIPVSLACKAASNSDSPETGSSGTSGQSIDGNSDGSIPAAAVAKDVLNITNTISDRLKAYDEDADDPPSSKELLRLLHQQSKIILKYQSNLDQTNAKLMSQQRLLQQIADTVEVPMLNARDGYVTSFLPPDSLSDDAVRQRANSAADGTIAPPAPAPAPTWGPLVPEMNKAPPRPSRKGPGGPAWAPGDRRQLGGFDARFHSTSAGATPSDHRVLPERIILVRHAQSEGNIDNVAYTYIPDPQIPLTTTGKVQAEQAGRRILELSENSGDAHKFFFYTSPYRRSIETYTAIAGVVPRGMQAGVQEEVQLREQDFGNFQNAAEKAQEKSERLRFGRFFYRFPNGESGADVYDRITIFEDHMVRDINAGRFSSDTSLVLLTHGLSLRVFLMRWFHWTVDEFLNVYNPPNAVPLVLERVCTKDDASSSLSWIHTKCLYRLSDESRKLLKGVTDEMCRTSEQPNGVSAFPRPPVLSQPHDVPPREVGE
eukprot:jgi/Ulvmu1/8342/UM042_0048.1